MVPGRRAAQRRQERLGDVQDADDVRLVHRPPLVGFPVLDPLGPDRASSVVDQDVARADLRGGCLHAGRVGHVHHHHAGGDHRVCRADRLSGCLQWFSAPATDDDVEPVLGKSVRGGGPDPGASSGDDGNGSAARMGLHPTRLGGTSREAGDPGVPRGHDRAELVGVLAGAFEL